MAKMQRKHRSPEEKVAILRQHLLEQVPVSTLCEQHGISPSLFYHWQKQFFENGATAFNDRRVRSGERKLERKIEALEEVVKRKNEVIAEISQEYVQVKKELGGP